MTVGQFVESLVNKYAAIKGREVDGTGFSNFNLDDIKKQLEDDGYDPNGFEYMYNGMTGRKMKSKIFICPAYYQRLKHLVSDKQHCLTLDHEVLTDSGWKFYKDLNKKDKIATLRDDELVYQHPKEILYYPDFEGEIYVIKTDQLDLQTTLNHRMFIQKDGSFNFVEAKHIYGKNAIYKNMNGSIIVNNDTKIEEKMIDYKGPVFCLSVPNETFYVRRNGVPVWTGNSRSRGPRTLLTRQPPEGRSREGGLRFGEMERDAIIAHGMARFLKERLMETADAYMTYICDNCGLFAQRMRRPDSKPYATKKDLYHCPACRNTTNISKIRIPYAFKLLLQELMAMNIAPRMRVKKHAYE